MFSGEAWQVLPRLAFFLYICAYSHTLFAKLKTMKTTAADGRNAGALRRVWYFYLNGFRSMTYGRTLWVLILVKLFIMFAILKVFFFPDFLRHKSLAEKQDYVGTELINRSVK